MPNITHVSIAHLVDVERIAIPRQYFKKTAANLDENRAAELLVVDPDTMDQYRIKIRYLRTETEGPAYGALAAYLKAVAAQTGARQVASLSGADIHRVVGSARLSAPADPGIDRDLPLKTLHSLERFVRGLTRAVGFAGAGELILRGLKDHFGFHDAALLIAGDRRLRAVACNGTAGPIGWEIDIGSGLVGIAADQRELLAVPSLARGQAMAAALGSSERREAGRSAKDARESVQSIAAVPLAVGGRLVGVLYLESERAGGFGTNNEGLLQILGAHVAATLAGLRGTEREDAGSLGSGGSRDTGRTIEVTYYQADDSVFADGKYVIKGVPGRILWKLLREHDSANRTIFTNRELRLDESLELPAGNSNLDSRLLSLRRRLEGGELGMRLQRVGRGRLQLDLDEPLRLIEIGTAGPMSRERTLSSSGAPE
jgi:putative methionine-R-sulfoxide reductase with GAF domain